MVFTFPFYDNNKTHVKLADIIIIPTNIKLNIFCVNNYKWGGNAYVQGISGKFNTFEIFTCGNYDKKLIAKTAINL